MKYALVISGVLAAIAMAAPSLVVLGYVLLIVPGLILTIAPTVFVYTAATAVIRRVLPISSPAVATPVAVVLAIAMGWAVMQPFRMRKVASFSASSQPDRMSDDKIALSGNVRLELPNRNDEPVCDYLCLAALDSPLVNSVTVVTAGTRNRSGESDHDNTVAYRLASAEEDPTPGLFPDKPGRIVREYRRLGVERGGRKLFSEMKSAEAEWALRLCGPERLRDVSPVAAEQADWIIRVTNQRSRDGLFRRVTIRDSNGTVHYRKSYQRQFVPAAIFYVGFQVKIGAGTLSNASFHLGRQRLEAGEYRLDTDSVWLSHVDLRLPACDPSSVARLRERAARAIDDPHATAAELELPKRYLGLFHFDATERDHDLIARIVADERLDDLDELVQNVFSKKKTPTAMRDAFAKRIVIESTSAELRYWLAECLANMPAGTFADPSEVHWQIWNTPAIYRQTGPFASRLADQGPERAMPVLMTILRDAVELPTWRDRRALVEGVRDAFVRLGPAAASAVTPVEELFLRRPSPILSDSGDAQDWRFTLMRMGVTTENLPMFPTQSQNQVQRIRRSVSERVRRYESRPTT